MTHAYGWVRDKLDPRDHVVALGPQLTGPLPATVSLRDRMPPVYDQGQLGSCTANAIAGALEYQEHAQAEQTGTPSRLFIYWNERNMEGTVSSDSGAQIRDGIKSINTWGAPDETLWPYNIGRFKAKPSTAAFTAAKTHTAVVYGRVPQTGHYLQASLAAAEPVVFGFNVYQSFEDNVGSNGVVPMPDPSREQLLGGHAVLAVGYKPIKGQMYFEVRNSWGDGWGDQGYCWMPAGILTDTSLSSDLWNLQTVS